MSRLHRQKIRAQRHEREAEASIAARQTSQVESVSTPPASSIEAPIASTRSKRSASTRSKAKRR